MSSAPLRVVVVSDSPLVRAGLTVLVHSDPARAVVTATVDRLLHSVEHDALLLDLSTPGLLEPLCAAAPPCAVGVTRRDRPELAPAGRAAGVRHLVDDAATSVDVLDALDAAVGRTSPRPPGPATTALTERELDTLRLLCAGLSNQQIAEELYVSVNTVKSYIRPAYRKIGARTRAQAMLWALRHGVLVPPAAVATAEAVAAAEPLEA